MSSAREASKTTMYLVTGILDNFRNLGAVHKTAVVIGGVTAAYATIRLVAKLTSRDHVVVYPRDTVILHQIGRGPYAPSFSPFVIKLELYLKIAKIPFQVVHGMKSGPKGKWPWIEYNGEKMGDSEFCMMFLNKKFNIDLNEGLSPYEIAVGNAFKILCEDHFAWCQGMFRYVYDTDLAMLRRAFGIPWFVTFIVRHRAHNTIKTVGIGRHSREEITCLMDRDLQSIADILGDKDYLLGDRIREVDIAVFGQLSLMAWQSKGNDLENYLQDKFPVLVSYLDRIKRKHWPDWDDYTTKGFTKIVFK